MNNKQSEGSRKDYERQCDIERDVERSKEPVWSELAGSVFLRLPMARVCVVFEIIWAEANHAYNQSA